MNTFNVDNKIFKTSIETSDSFLVKSFPYSYEVSFTPYNYKFSNKEIVLIDSKVKNLYNINHGKIISIDATEENKNINTCLYVSEKLLEFNFDKGNDLIVIGGGIIQDIAAFTCKMFKRGINWIYIPTTLLSQCDSCIGGKTALNFKNYKNQLALYSAPKKVIIDINFLKTLPEKEITSGFGEIIKLFLIGGNYYINNLEKFTLKDLIFHALLIKKSIIEEDEFEINERKSLNYGHSFGHALESLLEYKISHGESVLLGIEIINKLYSNSPVISKLISKYTNLDKIKNIDINKLLQIVKTDKKVTNGIISLIIVEPIGNTYFKNVKIDSELEQKLNEIFIN